jgi:hypothetical protein
MTTAAETFDELSEATPLATSSRARPSWIVWTPFVIAFVYSALLTYKPTRMFAIKMTDENYPVELGTFLLLMAGGVYGLRMAIKARRGGLHGLWFTFYVTFSIFLLLTGMEEISWGQWFFHFQTPEAISRINTQHEFTLHNLNGIGGHTVWLRLAFGVGGFIGMALGADVFLGAFRDVIVPRRLWAWFFVITVFALGDQVTDYVGVNSPVAALFTVMAEIVELLIAAVGCLYLWFKAGELLKTGGTAWTR